MTAEQTLELLKSRFPSITKTRGYYLERGEYNPGDIYLRRKGRKAPIARFRYEEMPHFFECAKIVKSKGFRLTERVWEDLNRVFGMCVSLACYGWNFKYGEDRGYWKDSRFSMDLLRELFDYVNDVAIVERSALDEDGYRSCIFKEVSEK